MRSDVDIAQAATIRPIGEIAAKLGLAASEHIFGVGYEISPNASLLVVIVVLALGIVASFVFPEREEAEDKPADGNDAAGE